MAVMLSGTYDALMAAGAPEDKARAAAEELAYENRFAKIRKDLAVIKWMVAVNLVCAALLLVETFA